MACHSYYLAREYPNSKLIPPCRAHREQGLGNPEQLRGIQQWDIRHYRGSLYLCGHHHWYHFRGHRHRDDHEHPSSLDPSRPGFETDRGRVYHSHGPVDRPYGGSSRLGRDEVGWVYVRDGVSARDDHLDHDHDQSQSARKQREEYEPTKDASS